jgi:hypothetical protein
MNAAAHLADALQLRNANDVDQRCRLGKAALHHGQQIMAASKDFGFTG